MTPDPIGLKAASKRRPQTLNLYSYVHNDPVNFVDPGGTCIVYWYRVNETYGYWDTILCRNEDREVFQPELPPVDQGGGSQQTQAIDKTAEASNILGQFMGDSPDCDAKFLGLGLDYRTVGTGNSTIKFIDPNGDSALLNMTLGQLGVTTPSLRNDKLSDWVIGNNAYGFTIWETGTIYLGDSFKLQSPQEQGITIAHELLHAHVQGSEAKILNRLGVIDPRTGEVWDETDNRGADAGLNSYLKSGCQKATL